MAQKGAVTMWENLKSLLLRLFGIKPQQTESESKLANRYAREYEDITNINFTAIFAARLASLAVTDSTVIVAGDNARAAYLDAVAQSQIAAHAQPIVSAALGYGGLALVPYMANGKIYIDRVPQNRFFVIEQHGEDITRAVLLTDFIVRDSKRYARFTEYELCDGICYIRNRATVNDSPCALDALPEWAGIPEEVAVGGCNRPLFGFLRCPQDNRRPDSLAGVPITYGCDTLIKDITDAMAEEATEYENKRAFIAADVTMFDKDDKLPKNGVFKTLIGQGGEDLWHEYSPEIRYAAYSARTQALFERLEKAVGTSRGILTAPEPQATATAVRQAQHDTWSLVSIIRHAAERAIEDTIYAVNVLCNYYGLAPMGEYAVTFDWDSSMLEDTAVTWQQLKDARSMGIRSKAEVRAWLTGETIEEAQARIDEIEAAEPVISDLIGNA